MRLIKLIGLCCLILIGCKDVVTVKPIISTYNNQVIGDSIIVNGNVSKIVFRGYDSFDVDSIIFVRNKSSKLIERNSYFQGRIAYERIFYDKKTGLIRKYIFQRPDCDSCIYVRNYDENGVAENDSGNVFFLINVDKIDPQTLEAKDDGTRMHMWIYHPNPPENNVLLYTIINQRKNKVFRQNEAISYMKEVWIDTEKSKKEFTLIDIGMDLRIVKGDTLTVNEKFIYKIVDN